MAAFVMLGLVASLLSQQIGWGERLRTDLFCVGWDIKNLHSINRRANVTAAQWAYLR